MKISLFILLYNWADRLLNCIDPNLVLVLGTWTISCFLLLECISALKGMVLCFFNIIWVIYSFLTDNTSLSLYRFSVGNLIFLKCIILSRARCARSNWMNLDFAVPPQIGIQYINIDCAREIYICVSTFLGDLPLLCIVLGSTWRRYLSQHI